MAELLKGAPVAASINETMISDVESLKGKGIIPTLAILRVGERADDISYEKGAMKRCEQVGVAVKNIILPMDVSEEEFFKTLAELNEDNTVHGILMFRPLPKHIDGEKARQMLLAAKDVDGCTDGSLAGVFTNTKVGFAPCTAEAAMKILEFYDIDLTGKNVAVVGRSLVVGKPAAMMLIKKNATVTVCHTRTVDMPSVVKEADIVIVAAGRAGVVDASYVREGQIVIDVGINVNAEGKLCGDVDYASVEPIVEAITPVPGGVGSVTTSVLIGHVVEAAKRKNA